jgi:HK97 family phage portal protein
MSKETPNPLGIYEPGFKSVYGGSAFTIDDNFTRAVSNSLGRFAGSNINYDREAGDLTRAPLVMAPVNWVASVLPEAPLEVVEKDSEGKLTPIQNHGLTNLWRKPNPYFTYTSMLEAFALSWMLDGNPYFIKYRNGTGEPIELWWAPYYAMWPRWSLNWPADGSPFIYDYEYRINSHTSYLPPEDVLHFRNKVDPATVGRMGLAPMAAGMREIVGDNQWSNYSVLLARGSGVPPFLLSPKANVNQVGLSTEDRRALKEEFDRRRTGDERGKSMLLTVGIDAQRLGQNPQELDLGGLRYMGQEVISSLSTIPAEVLNFGTAARHSSYNNVKEAREAAYEGFLIPLYRKIEETLTVQLLPDFYPKGKVPENVSVRFDVSKMRVLQDDVDNLWKRNGDAFKSGLIKRKTGLANIGQPFDEAVDDVYLTDIKGASTFMQNQDGNNPTDSNPPVKSERKSADDKPSDAELEKASEWWDGNAPEGAKGLFEAKVKR